ncbi:hypothetical protein D3C78_932070 [compost metagenome]
MTLTPSSANREAAMIGNTEFFAPLTFTLPVNLLPPRTINLLIFGFPPRPLFLKLFFRLKVIAKKFAYSINTPI